MDPCGFGLCPAEPDEQFREPSGTPTRAALRSQSDEGG